MKTKDRSQIYEFEYTDKDLFENGLDHEWCPLFGEIPFLFKPEKYVVADRCLDIIIGARRDIYEVPILYDNNGFQLFNEQIDLKNQNWPQLEEVPNYPPAFILAARSTALWNHYNIMTNAGGYLSNIHGVQEWHDNDEGIFHYARSYMHYGFEYPNGIENENCPLLRYPPGSPEEADLIKYDHNMVIQEEARGVPDYLIFAALAIAEAWGILERVLYYGDREKSIDVQHDLHIANKLLQKAYKLHISVAKKDIQEAMSYIKAIEPDVKLGKIRRKQQQEFGKKGADEAKKSSEPKRRDWLSTAMRIREKHKKETIRFIAVQVGKKNRIDIKDARFQNLYKYLLKENV